MIDEQIRGSEPSMSANAATAAGVAQTGTRCAPDQTSDSMRRPGP